MTPSGAPTWSPRRRRRRGRRGSPARGRFTASGAAKASGPSRRRASTRPSARFCDTPDGEWLLARGGAENNQLVAYPWGSRFGFAIADPSVETFYPALGCDGSDLLVAWTRGGDGALTIWRRSLASPRVDVDRILETPDPPDPEPPDPPDPPDPPTPTKAPKITITDCQPQSGRAPLDVRAVYATEAGSGPVETVEWLFKVDGAASWTRAAKNPASDPDHTYRFDHANTYLLAAKASGPGGTAQTGARRAVTVEEDPMPSTNAIAFRTVSGYFLCAEGGGGAEVNATRGGAPGIWEHFWPEDVVGGVAYRANNGMYLCADNNAGELRADRTAVGPWEHSRPRRPVTATASC